MGNCLGYRIMSIDMRYSGTQLSFLPQVESYEINCSGREQIGDRIWTAPDIMAASAAQGSISSKRKHRPKGGATGWLETRVGNRKRKKATVSYYYRWDSPEGRITEYVAGSKLSFVNSMLKSGTPALDILRYVIAGKKKVSPTIQRILLANKNSREV